MVVGKNLTAELHNSLDPTEMVTIDANHLKQVLTNLISNAFKFTHKGTVSVSAKKSEGQYIVEVTDTGIGIDNTRFEHIFKPFRQADEGLSRSKGGVGLGLSICKKMVELWGGSINVTSQPGQGSTFSFTIPWR